MLKKLMMMLTLLAFALVVHAQEVTQPAADKKKPQKELTHEERADKLISRHASELKLTSEQQTLWKAAHIKHLQEREVIKKKKEGPTTKEERQQLSQDAKASEERYEQEILNILDPQQETQWQAIKIREEEKKQKRQEEKKAANK
ncbi:MAG: hypothetical protein K1X54_08900 [Flavobacteriales bacterium]|nr:hypothetical protein [Flavobacteriales bacterium]